ncbi:MAG: Nif3-like dinuclear metal center hexameric protein [Bacteroidales bacterium]|jgi:dinuclear metal center YbgI/SA1388 family protein
MKRRATDVIHVLEQWAPTGIQEPWDNSGLCIGNIQTPVTGVLVCLDCTEEVVREAVSKGINMVVTHHPLIFKGLKHLREETPVERTVALAIKNDVVIYCMHTNADKVMDGVSGEMARKLGLNPISVLAPDTLCNREAVTEEPCGLGIIGDLPQPMETADFFDLLKTVFHLKHFKASPMFHNRVSKVALCGGSGSSLISNALQQGAHVYVSADFSYHTYFDTIPHMMLVDIGHYESEAGILDVICKELKKKIPTFDVLKTQIVTNPIIIY